MSAWVFTASLFLWEGDAAWHFVALPEDVSDELDHRTQGLQGGFGSVKVEVSVGATTWSTSVFPDKGRGTYVLPVKKAVRAAEGLAAGDDVEVSLRPVGL